MHAILVCKRNSGITSREVSENDKALDYVTRNQVSEILK